MIITLTLNPSIDYILQVPKMELEDTLRAEKATFQAGGKGINVSRVLTRLQVENVAWGFCGGDTGRWLETFLEQEGVKHQFVCTQTSTRINTIVTDSSSHLQLRVSAQGEPVTPEEQQHMENRFQHLLENTQWLSLGGSLLPGLTPEWLRGLIEKAGAQGVPSVLDADGEALKQGLRGRPYLIKPNQYELQRLIGTELTTPEAVIQAAQHLIQAGHVHVVVTSLAEQGAILVSADTVVSAKAPQVPVKSKIGAGDSMVAGILKGLIEKAPWEQVLRMGVASGTAAVMTHNTELCFLKDYEALLPQVAVNTLADTSV